MHKPTIREKSSLNLREVVTKALRLLRAEGFQAFSTGQEETSHQISDLNSYQASRMEIRRALIRTEYLKALALTERQKHPLI
jgi:hypothetical protein